MEYKVKAIVTEMYEYTYTVKANSEEEALWFVNNQGYTPNDYDGIKGFDSDFIDIQDISNVEILNDDEK